MSARLTLQIYCDSKTADCHSFPSDTHDLDEAREQARLVGWELFHRFKNPCTYIHEDVCPHCVAKNAQPQTPARAAQEG